ncbi:hypothetical protein NQ176_g2640 [Zarea fungicola]|uniref:Uncharacterized protein n=1 Tax=Zarea fungicola TaxID=93591 RepID=A0ACC1NNC8_9HYPO|nr:hypothetical protein NQ176_g2640 [Lecanicillium fungicola]
MQFSFILSALAFVTTVTSTQELKAAIKAIRPNIDDDVVHEAATGYLQALSLLGAAEADDGSDPKLVARDGEIARRGCCHCCGLNSGQANACFNAVFSLGICCATNKGQCTEPK